MAVRLADLVSRLHMREHVEIGRGLVVEHATAGRHIVAEGLRDKVRIGQQPRQPIGDLCKRARQCLSFEQRARFRAEFIERIGHHRLPSRGAFLIHRKTLCGYDPPPSANAVEEGMLRSSGLIALAAIATLALWPAASPAQEPYPSRTVKIVIPSAPGSTTDTLARLVADQLAQKWGKATIVENIPGGAMNIGASAVARAAPDGYTLMVAPPSPLSFNHLLYRDPGYDPGKFVPITMLAKIPNVLVVRKDFPAATLKELIDY